MATDAARVCGAMFVGNHITKRLILCGSYCFVHCCICCKGWWEVTDLPSYKAGMPDPCCICILSCVSSTAAASLGRKNCSPLMSRSGGQQTDISSVAVASCQIPSIHPADRESGWSTKACIQTFICFPACPSSSIRLPIIKHLPTYEAQHQ